MRVVDLKDSLKIGMFFTDIVPIFFYIILGVLEFKCFNKYLTIIFLILIIYHLFLFIRNLMNYKYVQEKIDNLKTVVGDYGCAFLTNESIICLSRNVFAVDFINILSIDVKRSYGRFNSQYKIIIKSSDNKKYKLYYNRPKMIWNNRLDIVDMLRKVKCYNPKVSIIGINI